jgi:small-conductance mechanosensitive channel
MIFTPIILFALLLAARLWDAPLLAPYLSAPSIVAFNKALAVIMVVVVSVLVDGLVRAFYWHRYWHHRRGRETPALIRDILTIAIVLLGLSLGLWWQEGLSFTGVITASGATAIILGIALQTVIQDLFAGLSVNLEGSYALGDWLTVYSEHLPEPAYGRVAGITWRSTYLTLEDGRRLMVPNHIVTANAVLNHSKPPGPKRLSVEICVDLRTPRVRVVDMLLGEALKTVRRPGLAAAPEPSVIISRLTGDAIYYHVRFFADPARIRPHEARSLMLSALLDVLQHNSLPSPVTQVELVQAPDLSAILGEREIREGLERADLFAHTLSAAQLDVLASRCRAVQFAHGDELIRQGDAASTMFIILEGAACVLMQLAGAADQEVAVLATGDIVGEMSLMTGAPRTATVKALTAMRVLEITKDAVGELLADAPDLYQSFSKVLVHRQQELNAMANRVVANPPSATDLLSRMRAFFGFVR